jgi:hypothetical protein
MTLTKRHWRYIGGQVLSVTLYTLVMILNASVNPSSRPLWLGAWAAVVLLATVPWLWTYFRRGAAGLRERLDAETAPHPMGQSRGIWMIVIIVIAILAGLAYTILSPG